VLFDIVKMNEGMRRRRCVITYTCLRINNNNTKSDLSYDEFAFACASKALSQIH
jgi:hypothetical protein